MNRPRRPGGVLDDQVVPHRQPRRVTMTAAVMMPVASRTSARLIRLLAATVVSRTQHAYPRCRLLVGQDVEGSVDWAHVRGDERPTGTHHPGFRVRAHESVPTRRRWRARTARANTHTKLSSRITKSPQVQLDGQRKRRACCASRCEPPRRRWRKDQGEEVVRELDAVEGRRHGDVDATLL